MALFGDGGRRELEKKAKEEGRLPPGQSLTLKWPVLHAGSVPRFDPARWNFTVGGLVEKPMRFTWEEFNKLPRRDVVADFHCVTRWSRFDNRWTGVPVSEVLKLTGAKPEARFVMVNAEQGYTANLPFVDFAGPNSIFAFLHDGEPLTAEHGYPVRLIVPQLYAWKSVKWVRGFDLLPEDQPGFWEQNGYNMHGDPFKEQRFSTD